jgi:phage shock protein C
MKHLYRSTHNKVFGGVFGGLGEYFEVDPALLRLVAIFVIVFTGLVPGIIFYIFALLIVPKHSH